MRKCTGSEVHGVWHTEYVPSMLAAAAAVVISDSSVGCLDLIKYYIKYETIIIHRCKIRIVNFIPKHLCIFL